MASSKRAARIAGKKYVPSAEQRADDERLRKELANADIEEVRRDLSENRLGAWFSEEVIAFR
jgi:hypothetical protein